MPAFQNNFFIATYTINNIDTQCCRSIQYGLQFIIMNIPSFAKKKPQSIKDQKKPIRSSQRHDTQSGHPLVEMRPKGSKKEQQPQRTHKIERFYTMSNNDDSAVTVMKTSKTTLHLKQLTTTLAQLREHFEQQYEQFLSGNVPPLKYKETCNLLNSNYFRFRKTNYQSALNQYMNVIQGIQLLMSKLTNNEKLSDKVMIRNEEDFVLFFKFFFSKPYTLINLPSVRKTIKLLWDQFLFSSLTLPAIIKNLRLWILGISAPLNPSMNKLHKLSTIPEAYAQISKLVTHKSNANVYIGVNDSDTLCLTPLMAATISKNQRAVEKLIKNGADIYCCPLTVNTIKSISESVEQSKYGNKVMLRKEYGYKERKQPDVIQYLKQHKRWEQIASILCWQHFHTLKSFKKDTTISDALQMFPNCSFQLDWKEYRGMLCFKQLPQDIVTVSKRDHCLRIDFHVKEIGDNWNRKKGFYSLVLRAEPKQECTLFLISHGEKTIRNVLQDKDIKAIKEKYGMILKQGNVFNSDISDYKGIYFPEEKRLSSTFQLYYQNYTFATKNTVPVPHFKSQRDYFKEVIDSELINYGQLEKDELKAILNQTVAKLPESKGKGKFNETGVSVDVDWGEPQALKLSHLQLVIKVATLAIPHSLFLARTGTMFQSFKDSLFGPYDFQKKLPLRIKYSSQSLNLQLQLKNLYYLKIDESIFSLQIRAKQLNFQQAQQRVDLSHLQDTVYMDEMYSISASRFMGKSEALIQQEEDEANRKFEELLKLQGIWSNDEEQQK